MLNRPFPLVSVSICSLVALAPPVLTGCESPSKSKPDAAPKSTTDASTPTATTPIAASVLRERAIEVIEAEIKDPDASIRAAAAAAAALTPARLGHIIEKGLSDTNSGVRGVTAMAIGRGQIKGYANRLTPLLQDPETITQVAATFALIRTGVDVDRSPLASWLLNDPSPWVKRQAADVLGLLGDKSAMPILKTAARQKFPTLGPEQSKILSLLLAEAMIRLGDDSQRPVIRAALYPATPDELEAAALAVTIIGAIQDREAVAQLIYLTEYRDKAGQQYPAEVRLAAAQTLAKLGKPQGYFIADQYVNSTNPVHRAQAAAVYGATKGPQNNQRLDALLNDPVSLVRVAAADAVLRGAK